MQTTVDRFWLGVFLLIRNQATVLKFTQLNNGQIRRMRLLSFINSWWSALAFCFLKVLIMFKINARLLKMLFFGSLLLILKLCRHCSFKIATVCQFLFLLKWVFNLIWLIFRGPKHVWIWIVINHGLRERNKYFGLLIF